MIAAIGRNGVIGTGNAMPWRLPSDFAHFKRTTLGKPLVMGRKTFESIGRPLPGRANIVVSRQPGYRPEGVVVIGSLDEALAHARAVAEVDHAGEVMIGGGGEIYRKPCRRRIGSISPMSTSRRRAETTFRPSTPSSGSSSRNRKSSATRRIRPPTASKCMNGEIPVHVDPSARLPI